jgi:hypothetical protein
MATKARKKAPVVRKVQVVSDVTPNFRIGQLTRPSPSCPFNAWCPYV